mmetsp:Transcript_32843/g.65363  ORF Transcript_32843/g.65363 Transcript_32843/m.65363 type:complete len:86 (-) Transcript_32843:251-508(-)|eukprot:CAMPEP_0174731070 /NCGR_PEP_ID=MMETSP1094-20130205/56845_1 /TAXON_ID=156173 /ORGANISM="Chrysochromulina brevifilum, Strain UTEX LB 985" /LENGTH=85 /DNA_ID=CAMNT_0015933417 /DNA_START=60 /DNA_END=317 /DNA_ORIENTATION=+
MESTHRQQQVSPPSTARPSTAPLSPNLDLEARYNPDMLRLLMSEGDLTSETPAFIARAASRHTRESSVLTENAVPGASDNWMDIR